MVWRATWNFGNQEYRLWSSNDQDITAYTYVIITLGLQTQPFANDIHDVEFWKTFHANQKVRQDVTNVQWFYQGTPVSSRIKLTHVLLGVNFLSATLKQQLKMNVLLSQYGLLLEKLNVITFKTKYWKQTIHKMTHLFITSLIFFHLDACKDVKQDFSSRISMASAERPRLLFFFCNIILTNLKCK